MNIKNGFFETDYLLKILILKLAGYSGLASGFSAQKISLRVRLENIQMRICQSLFKNMKVSF